MKRKRSEQTNDEQIVEESPEEEPQCDTVETSGILTRLRWGRIRLIAEAVGVAVILALIVILVVNVPKETTCPQCPDTTSLAMAFDQAWKVTWVDGMLPEPTTITNEVTCWRVPEFDMVRDGQELRAIRCVSNANANLIEWRWAAWTPGGE
ncbi:MAG: hypothetical protein JXA14_26345 [Anaerolineae bacterium]|nr:hypothetical protein [Anaerolineae bacterium]